MPQISIPVQDAAVVEKDSHGALVLTNVWRSYFSALTTAVNILLATGTTRPTSGLYVGYPFFDTTLGVAGLPITVRSLNPTVWQDAAGNVV